jgi:cytidylate kinase
MDTTRKNAPLACPDGALVIDTGRHSIDQVVGMVLDLAEKARS